MGAEVVTTIIIYSVVVNVLIVIANAVILASTVKLWTEIVKAENIKRIGKP